MGTCDLITGNCSFGCSVGWLGEICDRGNSLIILSDVSRYICSKINLD